MGSSPCVCDKEWSSLVNGTYQPTVIMIENRTRKGGKNRELFMKIEKAFDEGSFKFPFLMVGPLCMEGKLIHSLEEAREYLKVKD